MNVHRVIITGVARNVEGHLPLVYDNISAMGKKFKSVVVVICESASTDRTRAILKTWRTRSSFKTKILKAPGRAPHRIERIIEARNAILSYIYTKYSRHRFDYLINMDMDNVVQSIQGLRSCFEQDIDWDVICASNKRPPPQHDRKSGGCNGYDPFALRTDKFPDNFCSQKKKEKPDSCGFPSGVLKYLNKEDKRRYERNELVQVRSGFGGLAIYKYSTLYGLRYREEKFAIPSWLAVRNGKSLSYDLDCEHVSLHRQIAKHGGKIFINPKLRVQEGRTKRTRKPAGRKKS